MIIIEINAAGSGDVPRTEVEGAVAGSPGSDGKKARAIEAECGVSIERALMNVVSRPGWRAAT